MRILKKHIITAMLLAFAGIQLSVAQGTVGQPTRAPGLQVVDYEGLRPYLEKENDTTYIINFWATWCAPCIRELPHFQKLHDEYIDDKIRVILVSLDAERDIESKVIPFIEKRKLTPKVIVLSDPASNVWIDKIEPSWSGAIPVTIFYNRYKRLFFEKEFTYDELEEALNQLDPDVK